MRLSITIYLVAAAAAFASALSARSAVVNIPKCCPLHQVLDAWINCVDMPNEPRPEMAARRVFVDALCNGSAGDRPLSRPDCSWIREAPQFRFIHDPSQLCSTSVAEMMLLEVNPNGTALLQETEETTTLVDLSRLDGCVDMAVKSGGGDEFEGPVARVCAAPESSREGKKVKKEEGGYVRKCCNEDEVMSPEENKCVRMSETNVTPPPSRLSWLPARGVRHPVTHAAVTDYRLDIVEPREIWALCSGVEGEADESLELDVAETVYLFDNGKAVVRKGEQLVPQCHLMQLMPLNAASWSSFLILVGLFEIARTLFNYSMVR